MPASARATAEAAADSLSEAAREHKRLSEHHRKQSRALNEKANAIRRRLEAAGVEFVTEDRDPEGGQSHGE